MNEPQKPQPAFPLDQIDKARRVMDRNGGAALPTDIWGCEEMRALAPSRYTLLLEKRLGKPLCLYLYRDYPDNPTQVEWARRVRAMPKDDLGLLNLIEKLHAIEERRQGVALKSIQNIGLLPNLHVYLAAFQHPVKPVQHSACYVLSLENDRAELERRLVDGFADYSEGQKVYVLLLMHTYMLQNNPADRAAYFEIGFQASQEASQQVREACLQSAEDYLKLRLDKIGELTALELTSLSKILGMYVNEYEERALGLLEKMDAFITSAEESGGFAKVYTRRAEPDPRPTRFGGF